MTLFFLSIIHAIWLRAITEPLSPGGHLVSSDRWPETEEVGGLFQMEGTEFERVNLVYMPYCTSDAHMGAVTRDIQFPLQGERTGEVRKI